MKFCNRIEFAAAAYAFCLVCAAISWGQDQATKQSSENLLPNSTRAWISVPNPKALNDAFAATQLGELFHNEQLKPFADDLRDQIRSYMNDDQLRHGIKLTDFEDLDTGEICVAGILPRDALGEVQRNKHGIILLVDVAKCKDKAAELLKNTADELRKANAVSTTEKFADIEATKWTFPKTENAQRQRNAYHAIVGDWLISSDNSELFGQVVKHITVPATPATETLGQDKVFIDLMARTKFEFKDGKEITSHARWFVDPFGYLDLARVIAEEDQDPETKQRSNNFAKVVSNSGFDAIKGAAGTVGLATGAQEMLHRSFIFAPPVEGTGENKLPKSAAILDFVNRSKLPFDPEDWVPNSAASYVTLTWNLEKVVNNVHHVVDAVTDQNSFENMLKNIKESNNVDVRKLVECLNNRISIVTEIVEPIDANSEKLVVGIGILKDEAFVRQQVKNFFGGALKTETAGEVEIYYEEILPEEDDGDIFGESEDEKLADDEANSGEVLEQKFVAVYKGYVLISADKEYLKGIVSTKSQAFGDSADFKRIREMLDKFVEPADVSMRQFSHLDRVFEANYELLRNDELKSANTILARLLTAAREEAEKQGREPRKYDPAKMPDYKTVVAPHLGPTGWILESKHDGWLITSCLLKRQDPEEIVTTGSNATKDKE